MDYFFIKYLYVDYQLFIFYVFCNLSVDFLLEELFILNTVY
ncbi:hypothetical protein FM120_00705 [Sphingobacterium faecium PCAi_F2.5]|nr:hypothetical protein FM120_00705 [Sphingobacterium faecium PCAi_F2.5]